MGGLTACQPHQPPAAAHPVGTDVPILMYHKVGGKAYSKYWVSDAVFARQMAALKAYGYQAVSLADYLAYRAGSETPPQHPIIITFDDGYQDFYTDAVPILKANGMTAIAFIITSRIGSSEADRQTNSWDAPEKNFPANHLIWSEIRSFSAEGFGVGSHTVHHLSLLTLTNDQVKQELSVSRAALQANVGLPVFFFSYPGGRGYNQPAIHADLQEAGYQAAVCSTNGIANTLTSDVWALPRLMVLDANSVVYDPAHPNAFLMRQVDPAFPIPQISHIHLTFYHLDGSTSRTFSPGDKVALRIVFRNTGAPSDLRIRLILKYPSSPDTAGIYTSEAESHILDGKAEMVIPFSLPQALQPGWLDDEIVINDRFDILNFTSSGWSPAIEIGNPATPARANG